MPSNLLRHLPSISELLETPALKSLAERASHSMVVGRARALLDEVRSELRSAGQSGEVPSLAELAERVARRVARDDMPPLRPVINATGILLHTGLGRAPLAEEAIAEMVAMARGYASVELDLASGKRSQRQLAVESLLCELTGAEAAMVVNNNAGATVLALGALAAGREVIVSRGQLIEIGGSYRLPEVMAASGAILREVGTTNRTRLADYEQAINETTGALLLVHPSNFRVVGFTEEVALAELVQLGRRHKLPVIHDVGSGALVDFAQFGLRDEPIARHSMAQGADLALFSGDKLLGGPQCGILVGSKSLVSRTLAHPLARALRVDKLTLAALAATLRLYRDPERAQAAVPLLALLAASAEELRQRAERLAERLNTAAGVQQAAAVEDVAYLGGGSLPTEQVATWCVAITPEQQSVDGLSAKLRTGTPAVVGRVQQDRLYLDLRSVFPRQDKELAAAVIAAGTSSGEV